MTKISQKRVIYNPVNHFRFIDSYNPCVRSRNFNFIKYILLRYILETLLLNFWFLRQMTLKVTWHRKYKFERAKQSELSTLKGLLHAKLQILDLQVSDWLIYIFTILPVRSMNFNFFKYILLTYFLEMLLLNFLTSHDPQGHMTSKM